MDPLASQFNIQDWGVVDYSSALLRQMDLVDLVSRELARDTIVVCSHPPVVTLGRATKEGDLCGWAGETIEVNRGGRATYHGPSQIVVYPILDLNLRGRDLHQYMRDLETAIVRTLAELGVQASGRTVPSKGSVGEGSGGSASGGEGASASGAVSAIATEGSDATGVWIGSRKIASIGIGVRRWVSFHGLALNIEKDPQAFRGLRPCGFSTDTMISLEEVLGSKPDRAAVQKSLLRHLVEVLATASETASV